jgi:hypothetical protein
MGGLVISVDNQEEGVGGELQELSNEMGLSITCPNGIKATDKEMKSLNLTRHSFHGDWHYTIEPNISNN